MRKCWKLRPSDRPTFAQIKEHLSKVWKSFFNVKFIVRTVHTHCAGDTYELDVVVPFERKWESYILIRFEPLVKFAQLKENYFSPVYSGSLLLI